jgi:hypothetical protein
MQNIAANLRNIRAWIHGDKILQANPPRDSSLCVAPHNRTLIKMKKIFCPVGLFKQKALVAYAVQ